MPGGPACIPILGLWHISRDKYGVVGPEGGRGTDLAHLDNSQAGCVGEAVLHRRRQGLGARE